MLEHWIKPLDSPFLESLSTSPGSIGNEMQFVLHRRDEMRKVALVASDTKWANRVRKHLYRFASDFRSIELFDLGDLRSQQPGFITEACKELIDSQVIPLILGARRDLSQQMLLFLRSQSYWDSSLYISESIPQWVVSSVSPPEAQFIGVQQHVLPRLQREYASKYNLPVIRLGQSRDALEDIEPYARISTAAIFDLAAMRMADMPAQDSLSSSGFCTEEACRIMRYVGLSPALRCLVVEGHDPLSLAFDESANTTAQLAWYFLSGLDQRVDEVPASTDKFTQYTLQISDCSFDLTFFKSNRSGRWWVSIPGKQKQSFPCALNDYNAAKEDKITDRLMRYIDLTL